MSNAPNLQRGALVRVRPYVQKPDGRGGSHPEQLGWRQALVLGEFMERPLLWFFTLGAPHVNCAVQPLYRDMESKETGRSLAGLRPTLLRNLDRMIGQAEPEMYGGAAWELLHQVRLDVAAELRAAAKAGAQ